ncbi:MAG: hypothetical protein AB1486_22205 [Planctomycetota bacterium]
MRAHLSSFAIALLLASALTDGAATQDRATPQLSAIEKIRRLHERLQLSPRDSYLNYAIATIARRNGIDLRKEGITFPLVPVVTDDPAQRVDLFSLASGALALHESLQLTELLGPEHTRSGRRTPLAQLAPPELPSLDFEALLSRQDLGLLDTTMEKEARFVPADWIFARFSSGRDLLAFMREAELWVRHWLTVYDRERADASYLWRTFSKLSLPDPRKFPAFYEGFAGPLALAISDPFLREGTDVLVILPEGTPPLPSLLERFEPSGTTSRHWAEHEGRLLLATSPPALDRVLALTPTESLAASADFRYACTLLPATDDRAAFFYLSEAFMQSLVGARLRVLESRRVRCASHLRMLVNASLLFAEEKGRPAATVEELAEDGYAAKSVLLCPHGGTYHLEEGLLPTCSVHARLGDLTPHVGLALDHVEEEEAATYRRFARSYTHFWRRYFDPVAVQLRRNDRSWQIDAVVLPVAENSLYRNLATVAGGAPVSGAGALMTPSTVLAASIKVDRKLREDFVSLLRRWDLADERDDRDETLRSLLDGFGDEVTVGLLDDEMLFDFDLPTFVGEALRWSLTQDVFLAPLLAGASLPVTITCGVRDRNAAQRFLDAVHRGAVQNGAWPRTGRFGLHFQGYELKSDGAHPPVRAIVLEIFAFKFRLFYTLHENTLVIATRPDVLERVLATAVSDTSAEPFNLRLSLLPGNWKAIASDMLIDYEEAARRICMKFLIELQPFEDFRSLDAARVLGVRLACPDGGRYEPGEAGTLGCSLHGKPESPSQTGAPSNNNAVSRLLEFLSRVSFSLRFIPDGIRTTIRIER